MIIGTCGRRMRVGGKGVGWEWVVGWDQAGGRGVGGRERMG